MLNYFFNKPIYKKHRELLLAMLDLSIVVFSYAFVYWSKKDFVPFSIGQILNKLDGRIIGIGIMVVLVYAISFYIFKIHKSLWKYIGIVEVVRIGLSSIFSFFVLLLFMALFEVTGFNLSILLFASILIILLMFSLRLMYRGVRRVALNGKRAMRNGLIIGAGDGGYILLKEVLQNEDLNVKIVGFIDDERKNNIISGLKVIGTTNDLEKIVAKYNIEIIYIAIPSASRKDISRIFDLCQSLDVETKIMKKGDALLTDGIKDSEKYPIQDISIEDLLGRGEIKLQQDELKEYLEGKKIVVTGAGGSIGSELCRQIVRFEPRKLIMIDINENALYMLEQEFNRNKMHGVMNKSIEVISYIASIRDYRSMEDIFYDIAPDVVYHAAAHKHVPLMETRPEEAVKNNIFGTNNVMKACIKNKVPRFILISTDKAVNPTNVMGATKRMTEMLLQANGNNGVTKMAAVRFGNVLGSNGSVIPIFKKQIEEGGPITITDKRIIRYFMTIPEAAQLVLQAGYYADKGDIFVLDMGEPVKILDLAEKLIKLSGYKPYKDIDIVEVGLRPGEKMFEELRLDNEVTTKTKNDLIFKNQSQEISIEKLNTYLSKLSAMITLKGSKKEIKRSLLEFIKMEEEVKDHV